MAEERTDFDEVRKTAKAREDEEVKKAQEARRKEVRPSEPKVVFTRVAGEGNPSLPEDAPAAQDAKAFRALQLGIVENTPEEIERVGLPHPESQTIHESQMTDKPSTELVFTKDTEALPKGVAGAIIADGVFEIVTGTADKGGEPDGKSVPVNPKAKAAVDTHGSHPVRLEDDTHTNQS